MQLYGIIDRHSNYSVITMLDDTDPVISENSLDNGLDVITRLIKAVFPGFNRYWLPVLAAYRKI